MLMRIMGVMGIVCLLYYLVIISYAGFSAAFSKFWLVLGLVLVALSVVVPGLQQQYPELIIPKTVIYTGAATGAAGILVFLVVICGIFSGMAQKEQSGLDYIIVPGAQVKGTKLSDSLRYRLVKAENYLQQNEHTTAILSGGQGTGEDITEAKAMAAYLRKQGIARERLVLEERSENTAQNLIYSAAFLDTKRDCVGVVSNNFHVYRATSIARKQGYEKVTGIPAASDPILQPHMIVRESFAIVKDKLTGNM